MPIVKCDSYKLLKDKSVVFGVSSSFGVEFNKTKSNCYLTARNIGCFFFAHFVEFRTVNSLICLPIFYILTVHSYQLSTNSYQLMLSDYSIFSNTLCQHLICLFQHVSIPIGIPEDDPNRDRNMLEQCIAT
jgi:hypothetical protein